MKKEKPPEYLSDMADAVAAALSHFNAQQDDLTRFDNPVSERKTESLWGDQISMSIWRHSKDREAGSLSHRPEDIWKELEALTREECSMIMDFTRSHQDTYFALFAILLAAIDQCVSNDPADRCLVKNVVHLWDTITTYVSDEDERHDCYSLAAIKGVRAIGPIHEMDSLSQDKYRALAQLSVQSYIRGFSGNQGKPDVVREDVMRDMYLVQEPYRSLVLSYPLHAGFILRYLSSGYTKGDESMLAEILEGGVVPALGDGVL